ncbi:hypothetical protein [Corynebacterium pseudogenitalium]|uniref:hypothetical protein n=1 Tax=Corynebacterium pseudogenitalium TaxID=38303 RepID=UPI002109CF2D|nr:hypothetical protein [Corynebacterium pseudogenitalium]UUA87554.1 hypothetical protein KBP54_01500 [Corynebacterium pseudogenitalium]
MIRPGRFAQGCFPAELVNPVGLVQPGVQQLRAVVDGGLGLVAPWMNLPASNACWSKNSNLAARRRFDPAYASDSVTWVIGKPDTA